MEFTDSLPRNLGPEEARKYFGLDTPVSTDTGGYPRYRPGGHTAPTLPYNIPLPPIPSTVLGGYPEIPSIKSAQQQDWEQLVPPDGSYPRSTKIYALLPQLHMQPRYLS